MAASKAFPAHRACSRLRTSWLRGSGSTRAGNAPGKKGSLTSLSGLAPAPVTLLYALNPTMAIEKSGESSMTTHQTRTCIDACRYFGGLIVGAVSGAPKDELLSERYSPVPGYWSENTLAKEVDEVAAGSFRVLEPPAIKGTGYVVKSLEAALWAFYKTDSFKEGCLLAVNLGDDADTTGAVYGQIAGAFYGEEGIPQNWKRTLAHRSLIRSFAELLFELSRKMPSE